MPTRLSPARVAPVHARAPEPPGARRVLVLSTTVGHMLQTEAPEPADHFESPRAQEASAR